MEEYLVFGNLKDGDTRHSIDADISDIRVYGRAITQEEVTRLYLRGRRSEDVLNLPVCVPTGEGTLVAGKGNPHQSLKRLHGPDGLFVTNSNYNGLGYELLVAEYDGGKVSRWNYLGENTVPSYTKIHDANDCCR